MDGTELFRDDDGAADGFCSVIREDMQPGPVVLCVEEHLRDEPIGGNGVRMTADFTN